MKSKPTESAGEQLASPEVTGNPDVGQQAVRAQGASAARPSLWRNRDFMLLWSGQVVSVSGSQIAEIAFPLLVLALTHSPAQAGLVGAATAIPYLLLSLPAGALVDRWDRRRVMMVADTVRCVNLASIPVAYALGHLLMAQIYLVAMVEGTGFVFFSTAEVASLRSIVGKDQLSGATSRNQAGEMLSILIGPPAGGFLFGVVGRSIPFLADALSYLVSVISLALIRTPFQSERSGDQQGLWVEIREGVSWLWSRPLIRFLALFVGSTNLISSGGFLALIVLAKQMHGTPPEIGWILGVAAVGGIIGSILAGPIQRRFGVGTTIIGTAWIQVLIVPGFIVAPNLAALALVTCAIFVVFPIINVVIMSYRLALIPDALQGRVNSAYRLLVFAGQPVGMAVTGALLQTVGPRPTFALIGAGLLLMASIATLNRQLRAATAPRPMEAVA